jgi:hypothetical protein
MRARIISAVLAGEWSGSGDYAVPVSELEIEKSVAANRVGNFSFDGFSHAGYPLRSLLATNGLLFESCICREFEGA